MGDLAVTSAAESSQLNLALTQPWVYPVRGTVGFPAPILVRDARQNLPNP